MSANDLNLDDLTAEEFEELVQLLVLRVLGNGFQFPDGGSDGGRDGYFNGSVSYDGESWEGYHVVQAKFRRRTGDPGQVRDGRWAEQKLRQELDLFDSETSRKRPDYYYFATNVRLGTTRGHGSLDKLDTILDERRQTAMLKGYAVWGYKKLCALLADHADLRVRFGLSTPLERKTAAHELSSRQPVSGREALIKLFRLSDIGWNDAAVINEAHLREAEAVRLEELYVPRTVEKEILHKLLNPGGKPWRIFVVGDAGHGKTSLLWHLMKSLRDQQRTAFFLKATSLELTSELPTANRLTAGELAGAAALAVREAKGRGVVLMLDTLDLQIRDEARRDAILASLEMLADTGCQIVASCRPQEFAILEVRKGSKIELPDYDPEELQDAVRKHVRWAYWDKQGCDWENQLGRIQDAVTAGRPIKEICKNPLTLRMLFSLYRPNLVPTEIHQFALYRTFWDLRVKQDFRAGMPHPAPDGENLEHSVAIIALVMLAEGDPEVDAPVLERVFRRHAMSENSIDTLAARGILHRSANKVSFFHQTFFEHAAARWMLNQASPALIEEVATHVRQNPNDLFLAPVYEQLLLLLLTEGLTPEKTSAQERLVGLLQSPHLNHQFSGLYVFAHAPDDLPMAGGPLKQFLRSGGPEAVKRYIHLLPNRAFRANRSALEEAEIIWARGDWNLMIGALELLERLAGKDPALVCEFLKTEGRIANALETQEKKDAHIVFWPLMRVLDRVGAEDPSWFWTTLQKIHSETTTEPSKADIIPYIVRVACRHAEAIGVQDFERYFKSGLRMSGNIEEWKRLPAKTALGYGQVWARMWELRATTLDDLLAEIRSSEGFQLKMSLAGLAVRMLAGTDSDPAVAVWEAFERDAEISRRWLWIRVFWHAILEQGGDDGHSRASGLVGLLGKKLAALIRLLPDAASQEFVDQIMETVGDAACSRETIRLLYADAIFHTPGGWSPSKSLAKKLPQAAAAGVLGAKSFLDAIVSGTTNEHQEKSGPLIHSLTESMLEAPQTKWMLLSLGTRWRHFGSILTALDAIKDAGEQGSVPAETRRLVVALCHPPLRSRASPEEMLQLRLRNLVAFFGWDLLEPLHVLLDDCRNTRHTPRFNLLLRRLEHGCVSGSYHATEISKACEDMAASLPPHLRSLWYSSVGVCIVRSGEINSDTLSLAYDLIIRQGSDFHQLALFGPLLEKWVILDVSRAMSLARDFLTSPPVRALGRSATYRLSHKLQVPFARLIGAASRSQRESLLELAGQVHEILGASLIHLMASHAPKTLNLHLDQMLHDSSVGEFVRAMLLKQRRERVFQTKGYPWLSHALMTNDPTMPAQK